MEKKETLPDKRNRLLAIADGITDLLGPHLLSSVSDHQKEPIEESPQQSLWDSEGCYYVGER